MNKFAMALAATMLAGAAYAGEAPADDGDENAADARQGEEVNRICFGRNINGFKAIKGEDDAVLLESGVNRWHKAELAGACSYRRLKWAQAVAIDQRPRGGCVTPGDALIFTNSITGDFSFENTTRCIITDIYEWDDDAGDE